MNMKEKNIVHKRHVYVQDEEYIFAKNLMTLRKMQTPHLSQNRLAGRLGVCRSTYNDYEIGRRQAPAFFVTEVSRYFNISTDALLKQKLWRE